ncbi:MAG: flippase [bacterium]|nr:flippase [bacterium]
MENDLKPRIFSNSALLVLGVAVNALIGLYITRALARYLGVAFYGQFALAFVYLNFTAVIANFGFDTILLREVARNKDQSNPIVTAGIVLKLVFATAALLAGAAYLFSRDYDPAYTWAVVFLLLTHYVAAVDTFEIVHRAHLRGGNVAAGSVISQLLTLGVVLFGRQNGWPVEWLIAAHVFVRMPRALFFYFRLRGVAPFRWMWEREWVRRILKESAVIGLTGILWVVYFRVDTLMLEWMKGPEAVGQYAAAFKFIDLALLGSGVVMSSLSPLLAERWPKNPEGFRWIYQQTINYLAMLGALVAGVMVVFGADLIRNLYSPLFTDAIAILRILSIAAVIIYVSNALGHTIVAVGIQGPGFLTTRILAAVVNVGLNFYFIPRWGGYGAAWATVISDAAVVLVAPFFVRHRTGLLPNPWVPIMGVAAVWLSWRAYLFAGGGRLAATWPGRLAGGGVLLAAAAIFIFIHRRQFGELIKNLRRRPAAAAEVRAPESA